MWLNFLIVSELTTAEGPAPEGAVSFEDVAFTIERAVEAFRLAVVDRPNYCRTQLPRS